MTDSPAADEKPIHDAATVVLLRSGAGGMETFMLKRHRKSGFLGGAHVFPGGRVDEDDRDLGWDARIKGIDAAQMAERLDEQDAETARGLAVAAVRETFEESGVLLGDANAVTDADAIDELRKQLNDGAHFASIARTLDLFIDALALSPYARWVTPSFESRRFDTRFFVVEVPADQHASHDGSETTSADWLRPTEALDRMMNRDMVLAPPTLRTLEWLATFSHPQDVIEAATSRPPPLVRPEIVTTENGWILILPGDPAHSESELALDGPTRLVFDNGLWLPAS